MDEREKIEEERDSLIKKLHEVFAQLGITLGTDFGDINTAAFDKLIERVRI